MFHVINDIAISELGMELNANNTVMIGDTWHDKMAARDFGIPFEEARLVHDLS